MHFINLPSCILIVTLPLQSFGIIFLHFTYSIQQKLQDVLMFVFTNWFQVLGLVFLIADV